MAPEGIDQLIEAVAGQQQHIITRQQLLTLGLGRSAIARRVRSGRLFQVHLGVYSVGRAPKTPFERAPAAVLACGPGAALCGPSAFSLWGFDKQWRFPLHVCGPVNRTRPGIRTHKFLSLARRDVRTYQAIRVTSPARTFLDRAPDLDRDELRRALADARRSPSARLKPNAVRDILERNPNHPGHTGLLKAWKGYQPTRSEWEHGFPEFCRQGNIPIHDLNVTVNGYEVDAYYEDPGLIIELDSWGYHQDRHTSNQTVTATPTSSPMASPPSVSPGNG